MGGRAHGGERGQGIAEINGRFGEMLRLARILDNIWTHACTSEDLRFGRGNMAGTHWHTQMQTVLGISESIAMSNNIHFHTSVLSAVPLNRRYEKSVKA